MNQLCKVCGEPAAGFHFGAFTCEGCKSFFGRTYNNISAIAGCKNNGDCVINKKNRTACKACRLRKCLLVGMSKSGSRYGRRSNWFKIHCLLQEQHTQQSQDGGSTGAAGGGTSSNYEQLARLHHIQARQTYQDKTNPCIKSASLSPTLSLAASGLSQQAAAVVAATTAAAAAAAQQQQQRLPHYLTATKFLNGIDGNRAKSESRLSATPSDSGASSAGDAGDDCQSTTSQGRASNEHYAQLAEDARKDGDGVQQSQEQPLPVDASDSCHKQFMHIFRSHSEPLKLFSPLSNSATAKSPFAPYAALSNLPPPILAGTPPMHFLPASRLRDVPASVPAALVEEDVKRTLEVQHEPIDLSLKPRPSQQRSGNCEAPAAVDDCCVELGNVDVIAKPAPLDLTLVRTQTLTG